MPKVNIMVSCDVENVDAARAALNKILALMQTDATLAPLRTVGTYREAL